MTSDAKISVEKLPRSPENIMKDFELHSKAFDEKMKKILSRL